MPDRTGTHPAQARVRPPARVHLAAVVRLTKPEAFAACQALADADRCLVRAGHRREAAALAGLFELLESRLARRSQASASPAGSSAPASDAELAGPSSGR